ncbi:MAG: F0F1 ATP synthase subunit epsilon [Defluviitaleaceae bacterium]|nr:F0F1 ATP synthase subunit epsilon [Defluviitaleaceae bacterium]
MTDKKIEIFVITPDATDQEAYKFHGHCDMAILRCLTGDMGILPGRVPCSVILGEGVLRILEEEAPERKIAIFGGVFHFEDDVLKVLTQKAFLPGDIDITSTQAQAQEYEARLLQDMSVAEKDKIRKELHHCKVLLDVAIS